MKTADQYCNLCKAAEQGVKSEDQALELGKSLRPSAKFRKMTDQMRGCINTKDIVSGFKTGRPSR